MSVFRKQVATGLHRRRWRDLREISERSGLGELSGSGVENALEELVKLRLAESKPRLGAPMGKVYRVGS